MDRGSATLNPLIGLAASLAAACLAGAPAVAVRACYARYEPWAAVRTPPASVYIVTYYGAGNDPTRVALRLDIRGIAPRADAVRFTADRRANPGRDAWLDEPVGEIDWRDWDGTLPPLERVRESRRL